MKSGDVERVLERVRERLPKLSLDHAMIGRRLAGLPDVPESMQWGVDLALAMTCVAQDPAAIDYFEQELIARVPQYARRFSLSTADVEELKQMARIQVLCGVHPRIEQYRGLGSLEGWFRMVVVRMAMELVDRPSRKKRAKWTDEIVASVSDMSLHGPLAEIAPDRALLVAALERALTALKPRDKTVLKLTFVDGLNIEQIGRLYGVHRATVARWLVDVRRQLFEAVRAELAPGKKLATVELLSLINGLRSKVELSLSRILTSGPP